MTEAARSIRTPGAAGTTGTVRVELPGGGRDGVALVTIDRQDLLNALSLALMTELADTLEALDRDPACRAIVLAGAGDRAFAAGADVAELAAQTPVSLASEDPLRHWDRVGRIGTPLIAAVRGYALGGGYCGK